MLPLVPILNSWGRHWWPFRIQMSHPMPPLFSTSRSSFVLPDNETAECLFVLQLQDPLHY